MHRWFLAKLLCSTGRASAESISSCPILARYSVDNFVTKSISTVKQSRATYKDCNEQDNKSLEWANGKTSKCVAKFSEVSLGHCGSDLQVMETNGKRTRELLSPLHPSAKRKIKSHKPEVASCDFIPLSSSTKEKDGFEDFFIIDPTPSDVHFHSGTEEPLPQALASTSKSSLTKQKEEDWQRNKFSSTLNSNLPGCSTQDERNQSEKEQHISRASSLKEKSNLLEDTQKQPVGKCKGKRADERSKTLLTCESFHTSEQQRRNCHRITKHVLKASLSEASQDEIHEIKVIDPDVVEFSDDNPTSSKTEHIELIELSDSEENDYRSTGSISECENNHIDISNTEYISLQKLRVADMQETDIEIDDETLDLRKKLEDLRKWNMTGLGEEILSRKPYGNRETMFTVMSYNLLAQSLLTQNMELYKSCKPEHLSWQYRWELIKYEINDMDPDILMLQEVQASHYHTYYLPWLTFKGYEGFYKKRTGTKEDGCAIFYKTNTFSLVEHCSVEYRQPHAQHVLDRDNVGLIVKLAPLKRPHATPVCVATTHLLYNPRRYDVKLAQMVLFLSEIDRLCYEKETSNGTQYCPLIISGDFNAQPHTALINFLKSGHLHYEGLVNKTLTRHGSLGKVLGTELVPSNLGITDRCQHAILAQSRLLKQRNGPTFSLPDTRRLEETLIHLYHSDRSSEDKKKDKNKCTAAGPQPTGWLTHGFNLRSVYNHRLQRLAGAPEVTTRHDQGWTSVDYLFYSCVYSKKLARPVEGNLKLLARYGLLSSTEANNFSPLPSSVCPSDHFPLAAQFLLR